MNNEVNDNQQIDLPGLTEWNKRGQELTTQLQVWTEEGKAKGYHTQMNELLDLVKECEFLKDVQIAREGMIVEDMASQAGLLHKSGDSQDERPN